MPNWCYNTTSFEVNDELFFNTKDLLNSIKFKNNKLPDDIINNILNIMFNYNESIDENDYLLKFIENLKEELCIGDGEDYFSYDTRWGPPTDTFEEISEQFPFIQITNEYYSTADDYEGTDIILNGKYLLNESFTTSEKLWDENGHKCKDYLLDNIINDNFEIKEEDDKIIKFKTIGDIRKFYKEKEEIGEDPIEIIFEELDIYTFMNDYDLDNCEDNIREVFENEIIGVIV